MNRDEGQPQATYIYPTGWYPPLPDTPLNRRMNLMSAQAHIREQERRAAAREQMRRDPMTLKEFVFGAVLLSAMTLIGMAVGMIASWF